MFVVSKPTVKQGSRSLCRSFVIVRFELPESRLCSSKRWRRSERYMDDKRGSLGSCDRSISHNNRSQSRTLPFQKYKLNETAQREKLGRNGLNDYYLRYYRTFPADSQDVFVSKLSWFNQRQQRIQKQRSILG